jgi:serine/threonine protein kinase
MKYRLVFRGRGRASTSKRLKRISTTSVRAAQPGRAVVLRAKAKAVESTAPAVTPPTKGGALVERFRIEGAVVDDGATRIAAVLERRTGRRLTLTTFTLAQAGEWDAWERFVHGCRVLRSLAHGSVPRWVEHGERDGTAWLLTERVEGRSLAERMDRDERWTDAKLRHLVARGLDVLAYLHELNPPVFHCDIHPGAIVVSDRGDVVLTGFGRARSRLATAEDPVEVVGRDGYVAVDRKFEINAATDLYAFGATLLAIATGRDAAVLPRFGGGFDLGGCMKASWIRDAIAALLDPEPQARVSAAARLRAELRASR